LKKKDWTMKKKRIRKSVSLIPKLISFSRSYQTPSSPWISQEKKKIKFSRSI